MKFRIIERRYNDGRIVYVVQSKERWWNRWRDATMHATSKKFPLEEAFGKEWDDLWQAKENIWRYRKGKPRVVRESLVWQEFHCEHKWLRPVNPPPMLKLDVESSCISDMIQPEKPWPRAPMPKKPPVTE